MNETKTNLEGEMKTTKTISDDGTVTTVEYKSYGTVTKQVYPPNVVAARESAARESAETILAGPRCEHCDNRHPGELCRKEWSDAKDARDAAETENCDECGMTGSHKHINHPLHRHDCKTGQAEFVSWANEQSPGFFPNA